MIKLWGVILIVNAFSLGLFASVNNWGRWSGICTGLLVGVGVNIILMDIGVWKPLERKIFKWLDKIQFEKRMKFYWLVAKEFFKP